MSTPNPFDQQRAIPGIKHTLVVSSGKGGVGKSTVAFHLAHALSQKLRVGLLDADIHGPSLPRLSGTLHQKPEIDAGQRLYPITRWGMPLLSMGHIVEENSALVWRGPMLFKALQQLLFDVNWGELDLLVIDLPP
ncbi:MAG: Mrp/NBP35 family ATP-binding protein, partial [Bdellovibrionaceae bacterium]|nr:Mrp/NBP35 family ATP-binding protein [Pseudobdellovibrionaceae bacterium]